MRPGISNEVLAQAGVRQVAATEAQALCGVAEPGLWLPYRKLDGTAVRDGDKDYGRLRIENPRDGKKYHQAFGTKVHAYLPPALADAAPGGDLSIIEGEFKSLALTEAGFSAVGISGFFGYAPKGGETLVPELDDVLKVLRPARVLFCGDSDTALNYQFAVAAVRLAKLLQPLPVLLPRIPLNGPGKGADDCRQALGDGFPAWWQERTAAALPVKPEMDPAVLALALFEAEHAAMIGLTAQTGRNEAEQRAIKLAAALERHPLLQERVLAFLEKKLQLSRRGLNKALKAAVKSVHANAEPQPLDACYDPARKCYWIPNDRGERIEITETALARHLSLAGYSNDRERGVFTLDAELNRIQCTQDVLYAGPLAGHQVGLQQMCGQRILVTRAAQLMQPASGECPAIEHLILGLLDDEEHDQISYLMGWLKVGYEALLNGHLRPGQALAIAGPRDCGKSLLQHLITEILGGRAAKPYRYMSGATEFNGDLFGAEHLMIEDEVAFTDIRARRHFGARIKDFTVNTVQSCHGKNRPAVSLKPFWRVTITLNDEPENLLILPPIDDSLEDKLTLLKANKAALPADIGTADGRQRYWAQLMQELPMFLNLLVDYRICPALQSGRFGVKHFQHPTLIAALTEMSPEMRLMGLIDAALEELAHVGQWSGTATELEQMLAETKVSFEARRLLDWNNATGTYLGRLAKKLPHRVQAQRTNAMRQWTIVPSRWVMPEAPGPILDPAMAD